jgi:hypothetical protein
VIGIGFVCLFFSVLGFELRISHLLGWPSNSTIPKALCFCNYFKWSVNDPCVLHWEHIGSLLFEGASSYHTLMFYRYLCLSIQSSRVPMVLQVSSRKCWSVVHLNPAHLLLYLFLNLLKRKYFLNYRNKIFNQKHLNSVPRFWAYALNLSFLLRTGPGLCDIAWGHRSLVSFPPCFEFHRPKVKGWGASGDFLGTGRISRPCRASRDKSQGARVWILCLCCCYSEESLFTNCFLLELKKKKKKKTFYSTIFYNPLYYL